MLLNRRKIGEEQVPGSCLVAEQWILKQFQYSSGIRHNGAIRHSSSFDRVREGWSRSWFPGRTAWPREAQLFRSVARQCNGLNRLLAACSRSALRLALSQAGNETAPRPALPQSVRSAAPQYA